MAAGNAAGTGETADPCKFDQIHIRLHAIIYQILVCINVSTHVLMCTSPSFQMSAICLFIYIYI